jgi:outer membrane protein OmpA-like peptidoglycan-associated protein/tetratricopeptide (TPR) repeat protein
MKYFLVGICIFLAVGLNAQEECEYEASSKAAKLIEKAEDKKKYDSDERREFLEEALEEDENCLPCLRQLGESEFKIAKRKGSGFGRAQSYFDRLISLCEEYHSEPYYYLGAIAYATQEYEKSLEYFDKFLRFPDDDPSKFEKNYDKQYDEVKETIPYIEFYRDFYLHEGDFEPKIVHGASSDKDDYLPAISPDNELMFYTRKFMKQAKGDVVKRQVEEFTWSRRDDLNSIFDNGEALPTPFNMGDNYGGASISVDNKEMYIAKKNPVTGNPENIDIFSTRYEFVYDEKEGKKVYKWTELIDLGANINTTMGWESQPSLSGDGQTLYFATVRPECISDSDGNPSTDIFYSDRQEDGSWSPAKSLGEPINTRWNDKAPFMHSDSHTLYFASTRKPGGGGYDIWYIRKENDTWGKPRNMGAPINTDNDEHGMIVSSDGEIAYYASNRIKGSKGMDIYSFRLPEEARPEKVMILKGTVKDEEGEPEQNAIIEIEYVQSKEAQSIELNKDDGTYAAVISMERNEDVIISIQGEDKVFNTHLVVDKAETIQPDVIKLEMKAEKVATNKPFVIPDIFYVTNSADINRESKVILDAFAKYLEKHSNIFVEIRGHTDSEGSDPDNMALSMDRAFEVKGYLEQQGIDGNRIKAKGYGETKPLTDNTSEKGRALNRRTEFVVTKI